MTSTPVTWINSPSVQAALFKLQIEMEFLLSLSAPRYIPRSAPPLTFSTAPLIQSPDSLSRSASRRPRARVRRSRAGLQPEGPLGRTDIDRESRLID